MKKPLFAVAAIATALTLTGNPGSAQTPSVCATAVAQASDNILLRMQTPSLGAENRESAKAHLIMADQAAKAGNEATCWKELRVSGMFVALPSNAAQTALAAGH